MDWPDYGHEMDHHQYKIDDRKSTVIPYIKKNRDSNELGSRPQVQGTIVNQFTFRADIFPKSPHIFHLDHRTSNYV
jgi:hypothetical protein